MTWSERRGSTFFFCTSRPMAFTFSTLYFQPCFDSNRSYFLCSPCCFICLLFYLFHLSLYSSSDMSWWCASRFRHSTYFFPPELKLSQYTWKIHIRNVFTCLLIKGFNTTGYLCVLYHYRDVIKYVLCLPHHYCEQCSHFIACIPVWSRRNHRLKRNRRSYLKDQKRLPGQRWHY